MKITVIEVTKKYYHVEADSVEEAQAQIRIYAETPILVETYTNFIPGKHVKISQR